MTRQILSIFAMFCMLVPISFADIPNPSVLLTESLPVEQHQPAVGTVEHPTMDGGVINCAQTNDERLSLDHVISAHDPFVAKQDPWTEPQHVKKMFQKVRQDSTWQLVLEEIHALDLPSHLALIPMVESGYQADLVSQKGAAGLWQLMEDTAKDYGLSSQERFSVKKSTTAALTHLKNLHQEFNDWNLAFAAYNAGSMRIKRALHQNPSAKSIEELNLPLETRQYVSRLHQLTQLLKTDTL